MCPSTSVLAGPLPAEKSRDRPRSLRSPGSGSSKRRYQPNVSIYVTLYLSFVFIPSHAYICPTFLYTFCTDPDPSAFSFLFPDPPLSHSSHLLTLTAFHAFAFRIPVRISNNHIAAIPVRSPSLRLFTHSVLIFILNLFYIFHVYPYYPSTIGISSILGTNTNRSCTHSIIFTSHHTLHTSSRTPCHVPPHSRCRTALSLSLLESYYCIYSHRISTFFLDC